MVTQQSHLTSSANPTPLATTSRCPMLTTYLHLLVHDPTTSSIHRGACSSYMPSTWPLRKLSSYRYRKSTKLAEQPTSQSRCEFPSRFWNDEIDLAQALHPPGDRLF